jgi:hypothetical protein
MVKIIILSLLTFTSLSAQVTQEWASLFNGVQNKNDVPKAMVVDVLGNIYITGYSTTPSFISSAADYATVKYNSSGVQQWAVYYNGPASPDSSLDQAVSIAVDKLGNVYVTGNSYGGASRSDILTIKYNSSGVQRWVKRYNPTVNTYESAVALALDSSANVYVTGTASGSVSVEMTTIKYDSAGNQQWVSQFIGPGDMSSAPNTIKIDKSENIFVAGTTNHLGSNDNYATVKYNSSGVQQWAAMFNGPGNIQDDAYAIAFDNAGNVFVTGASWGNGSNLDYNTIKYNFSGIEQWVRRYNGPGNSTDIAYSMASDTSGNIIVTGQSLGNNTSYDYATIKYNTNGDSLWVRRYDFGPGGNRYDAAVALAVDRAGNSYVTGSSSSSTFNDYATIKYNSSGNPQWVQRYNGPGSNDDNAAAIAIDNFLNVYVTGSATNLSSNFDYATLKYSQVVSVNPILNSVPVKYDLLQNYPNPFNPSTVITYTIPERSFVTLKISDLTGKEISKLINKEKDPGKYSVEFNSTGLSSGIYLYSLSTPAFTKTRKMILIK